MAKRNKKEIATEEIEDPKERNIIGAMMTDKIFVNWCFKYRVDEDCFEDDKAKLIFKSIEILKKSNSNIDLLTVSERLKIDNDGVIPITCVADTVRDVDVKMAYTEMKKRLKKYANNTPVYSLKEDIDWHLERHGLDLRYIVDFDNNIEFAYFCERFKMWVDNQEINSCLGRLGDPSTSVYDRQFCAGVLFAVKKFEIIFGAFKETARGESMGINLYDLIGQYDSWKKNNSFPFPVTFRSKMADYEYKTNDQDEPLSDIPF